MTIRILEVKETLFWRLTMDRNSLNQLIGRFVLVGAVMALTGSIACAQSGSAPSKEGGTSGNGGGVLSGPKVEDGAQKQPAPMMGPGGEERRRAQDVPPQQWFGALRGLGLTEDQQTKIRAIMDEFQQAMKDYEASGGESIREMRRQARQARESGTAPPAGLREKLQKFENDRPKATPYQSRIWSELTDQQQDQMKARLEEIRAKMVQRRGERRTDGKPGDEPMMDETNSGRRTTAADAPMSSNGDEPRERLQARRNGGLDEIGKRRLNFLLSHQSAQAAARHPEGAPTDAERQFRFDDQDR